MKSKKNSTVQASSPGRKHKSRVLSAESKKVTSRKKANGRKQQSQPLRWPTERSVMFRPGRRAYVQRATQEREEDLTQGRLSSSPSSCFSESCVFCEIAQQDLSPQTLCLYRSERVMMILNRYPYNNGHLLVLPVRHVGSLLDLTHEESIELHQAVVEAVRILKLAMRPSAFNVGMNMGAIAGAGIPDHLHYHIVPRWFGDTNFFPLLGQTKVVIENLEDTYARLLPLIQL